MALHLARPVAKAVSRNAAPAFARRTALQMQCQPCGAALVRTFQTTSALTAGVTCRKAPAAKPPPQRSAKPRSSLPAANCHAGQFGLRF
jgi:hypothetical protein